MAEDIMKNFQDFNKATIDATKELVELNGRLMGKVLESQVELANLYIEGGEKQLAATKDVSDPQDFVKKQSEIIEEYTGKLSRLTEDNVKLAQQAGEELKNWLNRNLKAAEKK